MVNPDNPIRQPPHALSPTARIPQAVERVIKIVESQGGAATFRMHGRTNRNSLAKIRDAIPADKYLAQLVWFDSDSPAAKRRRKHHENWLYVRRVDVVGPRKISTENPQIASIQQAGWDREAEEEQLRRRLEEPAPDPPQTPN